MQSIINTVWHPNFGAVRTSMCDEIMLLILDQISYKIQYRVRAVSSDVSVEGVIRDLIWEELKGDIENGIR